MTKKQVSISSFKFGLDTRREQLVSSPGTLQTAQDGFITSGGDFEKRKGFFQYANNAILDTNGDQGLFGLQPTINGLYVFGSALPFGTGVTLNQPVLASAPSSGITYQQLKHPAIYDSVNYDRTKHRMVSALISEAFNGLPDVTATFADGKKYLYRNGNLVEEITAGVVMAHLSTNALRAQNLARVINALGEQFSAAYSASNAYLDVTGPIGVEFSIDIATELQNGSTGTLTAATTVEAEQAVPGVKAKAKFRIIAGKDNAAASATLTNDGTAPANNSTITIDGTVYTWKTAIATNGDVLIGASNDTAMQNLISAINYTGVPNTDYIVSAAHPTVKAGAYNTGPNTFVVTARTPGTSGNAIAVSDSSSPDSHCSWSGATLSGGTNTNAITSIKVGVYDIFNTATPIIWNQNSITTAQLVADRINAYTSDYIATASNDAVFIEAAVEGAAVNGTDISVTVQGQMCVGNLQAAFILGGNGFIINEFNINGVDVKGTITGGNNTSGHASLSAFCSALADAITAGGTYSAVASGNIVFVSKFTATSADAPLDCFVTITPNSANNGSGVVVGGVPQDQAYLVDISPSRNITASGTGVSGTAGWILPSPNFYAIPFFGTPPYTYDWQRIDGEVAILLWLTGLNWNFAFLQIPNVFFVKGTYSARFKCVVTDSTGQVAESGPINVALTLR